MFGMRTKANSLSPRVHMSVLMHPSIHRSTALSDFCGLCGYRPVSQSVARVLEHPTNDRPTDTNKQTNKTHKTTHTTRNTKPHTQHTCMKATQCKKNLQASLIRRLPWMTRRPPTLNDPPTQQQGDTHSHPRPSPTHTYAAVIPVGPSCLCGQTDSTTVDVRVCIRIYMRRMDEWTNERSTRKQ